MAAPSSPTSELLLLRELAAVIDAADSDHHQVLLQTMAEQHVDVVELLPSGRDGGGDALAAIDSILSFSDVDLLDEDLDALASALDTSALPDAGPVERDAKSAAAAESAESDSSAKETAAAPRQGNRTLRAIRPAVDVTVGMLPVAAPQRTGKQVNKSRKRVKDELEYLRQQVLDLEEKLALLKPTATATPANAAPAADVDILSTIPTASTLSLWKRVVHRQLHEKQKSEHENMVLRDLLEVQLRLAHSLEKAFCARQDWSLQHSQQLSLGMAPSSVQLQIMHSSDGDDTEAIYDMLAQQLEVLTAQVDAVFAESGLVGSGQKKQEIREGRAKTGVHAHIFLEVVDANIVPFDPNTTRAAMWKMLHATSDDDDNDDAMGIRAQYSVALQLRRSKAVFHAHMMGKLVLEECRAVIVCNTMSIPEGALFGSDRLQVREHWWTVMEELPGSEASDAGRLTIIQSIARMTPEVIGESDEAGENEDGDESEASGVPPTHMSVITDLVLGSLEQNLAAMHQVLENLILRNSAAE